MVEAANIRNVALVGHAGSGKTSLSEAILFDAKVTTRIGKVEDGNTVSDYEPEENRRVSSVQASLIPCTWKDYKLNILDTPGYDDFQGEVASALRVVESAVILVAANAGVEVGTERAWNRCEASGIPRLFLVNKMDRENADFQRTVDHIQSVFGRKCVPFHIPVGAEQSFSSVINLLKPQADAPADMSGEIEDARERLIEAVAESDDDLATRYLEGEEISEEELVQGAKTAIMEGNLVPILAASSTRDIGVDQLMDGLVEYLPSPAEAASPHAVSKSGDPVELKTDGSAPLEALVFKTTADPFVGKLSVFRVYQGALKSNSEVWNQGKEQSERIGQVFLLRGKTQEQVQEIGAGDIGAISKLTATVTGDSLCQKENAVTFDPIEFPVGYYTMAVAPKTKADVEKMSQALGRIVEEDPSLRVTRDPGTGETLISGLGDVHLDTAVDRIQRKFGAELETQIPKVPYRETITSVANAEYKHKKQTGGHGQYGHVLIRLEPVERGEGFQFAQEVVGGSIPREYIPAVEKGVVKTLQEGVVAGFPVVDVKAVLYDGSFHDVDSSGISFEIAGSFAVRKGVMDANPQLLEPVMLLRVTVPDAVTGDVIGDLNGKRGRILGMIPGNGNTVVEAEVPQAELLRYATDLRSITQGRGAYTVEFDHYEVVPQNITQRVIEEAKAARA